MPKVSTYDPNSATAQALRVLTFFKATTLSSAQMLALFDTPVELIPAPGAGKMIVPLHFSLALVYGTTQYGINGTPLIGYDGQTDFTTVDLVPIMSEVESKVRLVSLAMNHPFAVVENKALMAMDMVENPTDGDSDLRIGISYYIDTLPV